MFWKDHWKHIENLKSAGKNYTSVRNYSENYKNEILLINWKALE